MVVIDVESCILTVLVLLFCFLDWRLKRENEEKIIFVEYNQSSPIKLIEISMR
jgi:hypothetical protein